MTFRTACALFVVVGHAAACVREFPNEPAKSVTIQSVSWPTELHVTDVDTLELDVHLQGSSTSVTGLRVTWQSSSDAILTVVPLQPDGGASREDTLVAQLRAVVTARTGGWDTVTVIVEGGAAFQRMESQRAIRVTQKWRSVSAGMGHTCAVTVDSSAYCWGEGERGALGTGRPIDGLVPTRVIGLGDLKFMGVSAGDEATCGFIAEFVAYCWGSGTQGRLGNGDRSEAMQFVPGPVVGPTFHTLSAGRATCGVSEESIAFCWGSNAAGQLGVRSGVVPPLDTCLDGTLCSLAPRKVTASASTALSYLTIVVGGAHTCGIALAPQPGLAFCWGTSTAGALGNADTTISGTPVAVAGGLHFRSLSAGRDHTCGLTTDSLSYCWGANAEGQLGNATMSPSLIPVIVPGPKLRSVSAGGDHTCGIATNGAAWCWGQGSSGQLGNDSLNRKSTPAPVAGGLDFESISAGTFHTCGVVVGGALYCWGQGVGGRLGSEPPVDRSKPTRASEPH